MQNIRGKTEHDAIKAEMHYCEENHCPECGCGWYGNKNYCGEGYRTCYDCGQEYWLDIKYTKPAERRELPQS